MARKPFPGTVREVAKVRAPNEAATVTYSSRRHLGFIKRAAAAGLQDAQIATLIGVTRHQWLHWARKPEVAEALADRREVVTEIAQALADAAVGVRDPATGTRKGVNVRAAEVWLKNFAAGLETAQDTADDDGASIHDMAKALLKRIKTDRPTRAEPVIDIDPDDEDPF